MEFIHIRVPIEVRRELKAYTASKGLSMTSLIGDLIMKFLRDKKGAKNSQNLQVNNTTNKPKTHVNGLVCYGKFTFVP